MSASQRRKGAAFEREVCALLAAHFGVPVRRVLGQARDGGPDIRVGRLVLECKRRKAIAVYAWLDQVRAAAREDEVPVVVARADDRESLAIVRLDDFLGLLWGRDAAPSPAPDAPPKRCKALSPSFCQRPECGAPLPVGGRRRGSVRRFCSPRCRWRAWRDRAAA